MIDVSIDIETLGTSARAPVVSIGAVAFSRETGKLGQSYYQRIDWESALQGRKMDADTLKWWIKQDREASQEILKIGKPVLETLSSFVEFFAGLDNRSMSNICVWGNGATFDITILEDLFYQYGKRVPWHFWNIRDLRTLKDIAGNRVPEDKLNFAGVKHNALDDAKHQAITAMILWQAINSDNVGPFG